MHGARLCSLWDECAVFILSWSAFTHCKMSRQSSAYPLYFQRSRDCLSWRVQVHEVTTGRNEERESLVEGHELHCVLCVPHLFTSARQLQGWHGRALSGWEGDPWIETLGLCGKCRLCGYPKNPARTVQLLVRKFGKEGACVASISFASTGILSLDLHSKNETCPKIRFRSIIFCLNVFNGDQFCVPCSPPLHNVSKADQACLCFLGLFSPLTLENFDNSRSRDIRDVRLHDVRSSGIHTRHLMQCEFRFYVLSSPFPQTVEAENPKPRDWKSQEGSYVVLPGFSYLLTA